MEQYISLLNDISQKAYNSLTSFLVSIALIIISMYYLFGTLIINYYKKKKFMKIFRLPQSLENEMKNFREQKTKLIFHFKQLFYTNRSYNSIYICSQKKIVDIKDESVAIDYIDEKYSFKYYVEEKIILIGGNENNKEFLITVNKYVENHYNIIIDIFENHKTRSLEVVAYSKLKKCLNEVENLDCIKMYKKENYVPNTLRCNIINARLDDLYNIYHINKENKKKSRKDSRFLESLPENLLINLIYSKDGKIAFRRIYQNCAETILSPLTKQEIDLLKKLYENIIKKYINVSLEDEQNIINLKQEFISFDNKYGYQEIKDNSNKTIILTDLRKINHRFNYIPFFIKVYDKIDITSEELKITECLCFLSLILSDDDDFLKKIQNLIYEKNVIFNKYTYLSNKDKSLILLNLLSNEIKNKSNYKFVSFYELPEKCSYVQSELFFRNTIARLNNNSSLSFLYLQLNSGSGNDFETKNDYYKIRMIPLIEIKYHILKKFFYPYFFTYNSNNNILALNNVHTQIISYNESNDIGYINPKYLAKIYSENNTIKLSFLKFHEQAHVKFFTNYDDKLEPRYLLNDNFEIIDNIDKSESNNPDDSLLNSGESGNALEYFIFNDFNAFNKLMRTNKKLKELNNINLLVENNFKQLRKIVEEVTKDIKVKVPYNNMELNKIYKEKIKHSKELKNKKKSEIKLSDLEIFELY